ncbi:MAG: hypothetical protein GY718_07740 [Lentisphaerae bacterium]|nr:hypothetical protein [Lentisphaerota bacterium]
MIKDNSQNTRQDIYSENEDILNDFLRCFTMFEKALDRLGRQMHHSRSQYPEIFFEIEEIILSVRAWIENFRLFSGFTVFQNLLGMLVQCLTDQIAILIETMRPAKGKKGVKKNWRIRNRKKLCHSIDSMIKKLIKSPDKLRIIECPLGDLFEKALIKSFEKHCIKKYDRRKWILVSQRGEKTYIFPWNDPEKYQELVADRVKFKFEVVNRLKNYAHATGHKPGCKCSGKYIMRGTRNKPRKTVMPGGKKQEFTIRIVSCADCGQRFSLLPSFIPREKHFSIDIIGQILRDIVLFSESINGVLKNMKYLCGREIKSKQTIFNWLRWIGTHHPATLLTRAGVTGSGYFQEDEGFEKEPCLRTYTVVMVEPQTMVVWHIDYTDHVDEESLTSSFKEFFEKIDFKVLGISKDRWEPATNALKNIFYKVWIGFCQLHCLKKMSKALHAYQKETKCSDKEVNRLYKKFRKVLKTATSAGSMRAMLKSLNDEAFEHPLLKKRVDELKENAVRYTSHKKRKGITTTTSMADNFLKIIKRKLRQVGSFRDKDCTKLFFNATANIRNFVPFLSGANNAHKSPFRMAGGEAHGLSWMQAMNMHNAFLFTPNAF